MALLLLWKKSVPMQRFLCLPPISSRSKCFSCSSGEESEMLCSGSELRARFEAWAVEHGKSYNTNEEKEKRFEVFKDKVKAIEKYNATVDEYPWCKVGLNMFSDQTWDELRSCSHTQR